MVLMIEGDEGEFHTSAPLVTKYHEYSTHTVPLFLFLGGNNHSQVPSDKEHKLNTHFCSSVDQTYVGIGFIYLHCQVQLNKVSQRSVCGSCVLSQE